MGLFEGTRVTTNTCMAEVSVESYGVDCTSTSEVIERRKSISKRVNLREEDILGKFFFASRNTRRMHHETAAAMAPLRGAKTTRKKLQLVQASLSSAGTEVCCTEIQRWIWW